LRSTALLLTAGSRGSVRRADCSGLTLFPGPLYSDALGAGRRSRHLHCHDAAQYKGAGPGAHQL